MKKTQDKKRKEFTRFNNKVVLVTGGTSGMGRETAGYFAREGALVHICGTNLEKGIAAAKYIQDKFKKSVYFHKCDLTKPNEVKDMVEKITRKYHRIDISFNNAGISSKTQQLSQVSVEEWNNVLNVNLTGVFYSMKYVIEEMKKNKNGGVIINNASAFALLNMPLKTPYNTSKAAVIALTKSAALDHVKDNIRINVIAPGFIEDTGMNSKEKLALDPKQTQKKLSYTPMNRFGILEDVALTVLWLCSNEATFITGAVFSIDGGFSAGK